MFNNKRVPIDYVTKNGKRIPIYAPIGERFTLPSLTVPDQSIPLKTLITRYRRDGTQMLQGVFSNDDDTIPPGLERMEKTDMIDFMRDNAKRIVQARSTLDKRTASQKEKDAKRAFDEAVAKQVESLKDVK